jgi:hypothetical protein
MTRKQNPAPSLLSEWQATTSGNAELKLSAVPAGRNSALQMDFDFKGGGGFVVARRVLGRPMPREYAVSFRLRGRGALNSLELKLVDATGQNVWRHVKKDLRFPARWKRMRVESQEIEFAWGPSSGSDITQLGSVEFAIVAGEGGKGTLWLADVEIEDCSPTETPKITASSALPDFEAAGALVDPGWKPRPDDLRPWIGWAMRPRAVFVFVPRTPASVGKRCMPQRGWAANARTCIYPSSRLDWFAWNSTSHSRVRFCACNRSNFRAPSMPFGTASSMPRRAAGIRVGCIANRACGRRSARHTVLIAR